MEKTTIPGRKPREATRVGLGTWAIGGWMWGGSDEEESIRTIHSALDRGIDLLDTAPAYGQGRSEEIVGKALERASARDRVTLVTKVGLEWDADGEVARNASRERIFTEVEDSLRRLRTDRIDVYMVHWPDPRVPFEETATALAELLERETIGSIAVSNFSPEQMDAFGETAPLHVAEPPYNLFERGAEDDVLPYCAENGIATLTYGVLCRGLLSGSMSKERDFEGDDLRNEDPKFQEPRYDRYLAAVDALDRLARDRWGKRVIHLAARWALDRPGVDVVLWGARRPDQLEPIEEVWDFEVDDEAAAEIDRIVAEHVPDPVGPEFMAPPD
ncbi:MAG: aldo/keto reductase, partial [Gemmatimonadota bacterium]|nr:aldo/keto reductase [Gemmatimonadota bacterium]